MGQLVAETSTTSPRGLSGAKTFWMVTSGGFAVGAQEASPTPWGRVSFSLGPVCKRHMLP